ncbi:MAG: DUF5666 domain-containing protein [Acidimicrobiales bacterium]
MPSTREQDNAISAGRRRREPPGLLVRRVPVVLVAGLALAACGSSSSSAPAASSPTTAAHATGHGGGKGGGAGGGLAKGVTVTVQSASATQLSVKTKAGVTKTVVIGSSTTITEHGQTASASAIKAGQRLLVKGSRNSAGQIVATSIVIE